MAHGDRLMSSLLDWMVEDFLLGLSSDSSLPFKGCCCYWDLK